MRVILELGKILLSGAARAAARRLHAAADRLSGDTPGDEETFPVEAGDGPLITREAEQLIAAYVEKEEPAKLEPLEGSVTARGRKVGQQWAR